jgi:D-glycero-alpha-D-manno-heptose-7-phosphate kinase
MQFKSNRFDELASLLNESWKLKKLYAPSITNSTLEDLYDKAIHFGAQGGKLLGAGGGGFFLLVADPDVQRNLKSKMPENKFIPISFDFQGCSLIHKSN